MDILIVFNRYFSRRMCKVEADAWVLYFYPVRLLRLRISASRCPSSISLAFFDCRPATSSQRGPRAGRRSLRCGVVLPTVDRCLETTLAGTGGHAGTCLLPTSARTAAPAIKDAYFLWSVNEKSFYLSRPLGREAPGGGNKIQILHVRL